MAVGFANVGTVSFLGVGSGLDFNSIIAQLTQFKQIQLANIDSKIATQTSKKTAFSQLQAMLLSIELSATTLGKPSTFKQTTSTSSNESVAKVTGTQVSTLGSFQLTVDKIAAAHQIISTAFADNDTAISTASGAITVEVGGGFISRKTPLTHLRAQQGIEKGKIKITDKQGNTTTINLVGALSVKDVLDKINNSTTISVKASVQSDRIIITDTSGGSGTLKVEDTGNSQTALNLGILGQTTGTILYGSDINFVASSTKLTFLNDFLGVRKNGNSTYDFFITDTDGTRFGVDIASTVSNVGQVISTINSAAVTAGSSLRAQLNEDKTRFVLTDATGAATIRVSSNSVSGIAVVDLGFGYASGASFVQYSTETFGTTNRIIGSRIIPTLESSMRDFLNGGQNFISTDTKKGVKDGNIFLRDKSGDTVTVNVNKRVSLSGSATSTTTINVAVGTTDGLAIGNKIRIVNNTTGSTSYRTITGLSSNTITFNEALSFASGAVTVNTHTETVNDIINLVNQKASTASVNVTMNLNPMENGFMIKDSSNGAAANLMVSGTSGSDLGLVASSTGAEIIGSDLDIQYLSHDTLLANLNGGNGVVAGKIQIQDTTGKSFQVDLSQSDDTTLGKVITDINGAAVAAGSSLKARINDTGDGLLLEDSAAGTGAITVTEVGNTSTAKDLNILGTAQSGSLSKLDGSFEKTISIDANSSLDDIAAEINSSTFPLFAQVLNTGDPLTPYRLNIIATNSGEGGRIVLNSSITGLSFQTSAKAQNSVVVVGSDVDSTNPIVVTSNQNTLTNVIPGLTINLISSSQNAITITVSRDINAATTAVTSLVEDINDLQKEINSLTLFDQTTNVKGTLFADGTVNIIDAFMTLQLTKAVSGITTNKINTPQEIGIEIQNDGLVSFDPSKFQSAMSSTPDEVIDFFTKQKKIEATTPLKKLRSGLGIEETDGKSDFIIILKDAGLTKTVDIDEDDSVQTMFNKVNLGNLDNGSAVNSRITMSIGSDGFSFQLTDASVTTKTIDSTASPTVFTDAALINRNGTYVIGATVEILDGAGVGQTATVTGYVSGTGQITVNSPLTMGAGTQYKITRALQVDDLNSSPAASQLGILQTADSNDVVIKGFTMNLDGDPGFSFAMNDIIDSLLDNPGGVVTSKMQSIDDIIKRLNEDKEQVQDEIAKQEEQLVLQFSKLEQFLAQSQSVSGQLSALLGNIQGIAGSAGGTFGI